MSRVETLTELIDSNRKVDRALIYLEGEKEERRISYGELYERALGILFHLQKLGARPGDKLILFLNNNEQFLDAYWAGILGGIVGALLTGVFNSPALGGPGFVADWVTATMVSPADYSIAGQVWIQLKAVLLTIVWSGVVSLVAYKIVDMVIGLRVPEDEEREGLDITSHGETAYSK